MNNAGIADFRSDTVTQPTERMRDAMRDAPVGDDVFGEDPTVNALEAKAAALLGMQAALFISSGTMGNLLAVLSHTEPGNEIIAHAQSHIILNELAGCARIAGVMPRIVEGAYGVMPVDTVEGMLRGEDLHAPKTALVCVENTHNACGGAPLPMDYLKGLRRMLDKHGVPLHMDGARLFNAAAALNVPVRDIAACAHSVTFCLSKGLSAPVGSVLCGEAAFIERARRFRKMLGGGTRQAGVLAAAGLVALDEGAARIAEDHANAAYLASALSAIEGVAVDDVPVRTNILYVTLPEGFTAARLEPALKERALVIFPGGRRLRLITHRETDRADCERLVNALTAALGGH